MAPDLGKAFCDWPYFYDNSLMRFARYLILTDSDWNPNFNYSSKFLKKKKWMEFNIPD